MRILLRETMTAAVPPPARTHRAKRMIGNHEDGYLSGLDSLIDVWARSSCSWRWSRREADTLVGVWILTRVGRRRWMGAPRGI